VTTPPPPEPPSWPPPQQQPQQPPQQQPWQQPAAQQQPWQQQPQQPWQQQAPQPGYGYPAYGPGYPPAPPTSGKATAVMVLGIVAIATFFIFCGIGVFAAIAALVIAPGARREIAASGGQLEGEGKIKAGVILSWVTIGLTVLAIAVLVAIIAIAASSSSETSSALHATAIVVT
jgi:hypothetical protein